MFTKYVLPLAAAVGVVFAGYSVFDSRKTPSAPRPMLEPPTAPSRTPTLAGAGLIEARMENIPIGVTVPGVVVEIFVRKGDHVKPGDPLFRIDDREYRSQLKIREAELASAEARLHRLEFAPRAEDVPPAEAAVAEARARLSDADAKMRRSEKLYHREVIAPSDFDIDRFAFDAARATVAKADADLNKIKAGSWKEDIQVARAEVQLARSQVDDAKTTIDRLTVRALAKGDILQLNVRPGQYAALAWREPMIVMGDVNRLHLRVDIDEADLPYFAEGADAVATLKGRPQTRFPLKFVYVEPYVIPKQNLTGANSERVDTRVLQVIYELPDERPGELHVGQQMDVYLNAARIVADASR